MPFDAGSCFKHRCESVPHTCGQKTRGAKGYDLRVNQNEVWVLAVETILLEFASRYGRPKQHSAYLRDTGQSFDWDGAAYYQDRDKPPAPSEESIETLGLEERYSYVNP